jgi:hypothetical protein
VGSGQRPDLGALWPRVVGTGCGLLESGHYFVAGMLGERPQVPFLALASLSVGRETALDGHLFQLTPRDLASENAGILRGKSYFSQCIKYSTV